MMMPQSMPDCWWYALGGYALGVIMGGAFALLGARDALRAWEKRHP